jgi:hypothetical protein
MDCLDRKSKRGLSLSVLVMTRFAQALPCLAYDSVLHARCVRRLRMLCLDFDYLPETWWLEHNAIIVESTIKQDGPRNVFRGVLAQPSGGDIAVAIKAVFVHNAERKSATRV